jgi:hypothetical protein
MNRRQQVRRRGGAGTLGGHHRQGVALFWGAVGGAVQGRCPGLVLQLDPSALGLLQVGSRSGEENIGRRASRQRL